MPLPGRLNGVNASLGHDVLGFRVDLSGGALKGANDAVPSYRGTMSVSRGVFLLMASGQHGDLFDYGSLVATVHAAVPRPAVQRLAGRDGDASRARPAAR